MSEFPSVRQHLQRSQEITGTGLWSFQTEMWKLWLLLHILFTNHSTTYVWRHRSFRWHGPFDADPHRVPASRLEQYLFPNMFWHQAISIDVAGNNQINQGNRSKTCPHDLHAFGAVLLGFIVSQGGCPPCELKPLSRPPAFLDTSSDIDFKEPDGKVCQNIRHL